MRPISIEDYVFKWVFWPDRFFTTSFFVAGDVLFQCNFSFCFFFCVIFLCVVTYFLDLGFFPVQCFHGQIFSLSFFR